MRRLGRITDGHVAAAIVVSAVAVAAGWGSGRPATAGEDSALDKAMAHLVAIDPPGRAPRPGGEDAHAGHMDTKGPHPMHVLTNPAERARQHAQLEAARAAARKFPTLADATAHGFIVTPLFEPGIGVHAINWTLVGRFDPGRPSMLLFDGMRPKAKLIALSYYIVGTPGRQPAGFAGDDDHWHNHIDICIRDGVLLHTVHKPKECAEKQGVYLGGTNLWMLHAWVVDGQQNPWGIFSTYNPQFESGTAGGQ